jgi:hypothetical protein
MFEFFGAIAAALAVAAPVVENLGKIAQGGRHVLDFAADILGRFRKNVPAAQQQIVIVQALTQAAAMPQVEFDKKVAEIVDLVLIDQPPEQKKAATEYLKLLPARIRTTFMRPEDRTGKTVPAGFTVHRPEDILGFIPPRPPRFKVGDTPPEASLWILTERLGIGGFGEVWKARHYKMQNTFTAFKFCLDPVSQKNILENEMENVELVKNELTDHPNIVKLLNAYLEGDTPWLQYEYIPGGDLGQLVSNWANDVAVRAAMAVEKTTILAETLAHCHNMKPRCLIHRDMKRVRSL